MCAAAVALITGLTGCASAEEGAAGQAAQRFYSAISAGQGDRACALLTPRAAESVESGGEACARAVTTLVMPGGEVRGAEVWGDEAQVRLVRDTVFLHRFPQGWLVRAAGCRPHGELPYDCEVEG
ncbi:hypothetical protein Psi01_68060 [Planobispora siamensis]|uniref:Lipoprotein n=2 Tax=Planobispora siamensis TaxID=936338 RepID=A0A8J3SKK9_9ACTN|nr:hypothetical protein Psi01_68060 [Planobispora siamensis]